MAWELKIHPDVRTWLHSIRPDRKTSRLIGAALNRLTVHGPALGRPLVDTLIGSHMANLKELRPGSARMSEIRILFVFDPERRAVLLVAGDKAGRWSQWYRDAIPVAESRYESLLKGEW